MTIEEIKGYIKDAKTIGFQLPDGSFVPSHFHVTEVGKVSKSFIDCGGTLRHEEVANFQLWQADDYDHRLHPEKLIHIIELSQEKLLIGDLPIEVEYQGATIGKYYLSHNGEQFELVAKHTDCLAKDKCEVPENKMVIDLAGMSGNSCAPGSGCC